MIIDSADKLTILFRRLEAAPMVVYDAETSGLDKFNNHVVGHVITIGPSPDDTFYWPVRHLTNNYLHSGHLPQSNIDWDRTSFPEEQKLIKILSNKPLIMHNSQFDMGFLHQLGWWPNSGIIHDTMVLAFVVNDLSASFSLENSCREHGVVAKLGDVMYSHLGAVLGKEPNKKLMSEFWRLAGNDPIAVDYACGDGTSTWELNRVLWEKIHKPYYQTGSLSYDLKQIAALEMALIPVLFKKHALGIKIDEEQLLKVTQHFEKEYEAAALKVGAVNSRSNPQVKAYMEANGVTGGWPLTAKGAASFKEEFLLTNEPGRALIAVRKNRTLLDNFLYKMRDSFLHKGRCYPFFNQTKGEEFGVITGRMSTTAPNVGAQPGKRQGKIGELFRSIYIPDDGYAFTEADYKSCEIVIAGHYSDAKVWRRGAFNAANFHGEVAQSLGIPRPLAKAINLGLMTGLGSKSFALKAGLTEKEGRDYFDKFFNGLPEVKVFQKTAANSFLRRGFVRTLCGRRLQLKDDRLDYQAVNRLTQGGNADICKSMMIALDSVPDLHIPMTVYDSALFMHRVGDTTTRDKALHIMCNMQGLNIDMSVPMGIEYNTIEANSWGAATFGEPQESLYYYKGKEYIAGSINPEAEETL